MAKCSNIEHWSVEGLQNVIGTMDGIHKSHVKLGDTLDGVQANLSSWGGLTAEAWHRYHNKLRVDLDDQGRQAKAVADKLRPLYDDVLGIKAKYRYLKSTIEGNGTYDTNGNMVHWKLNDDGSISGASGDLQGASAKQQLEDEMKALLRKADVVDQEIADALKAITTPGGAVADGPHVGELAPKPSDSSILASNPVGGPDGNPPYANGATATMAADSVAPNASASTPLTANPPGYADVGPGAQRDQNWKDFLNGKNADGTVRANGMIPAALPRPEAVSDPTLRTVGAAGRQQGVSYAWGGNNSVHGPTRGTLNGDGPDQMAHKFHDDQRIGFDCGGLARFAVWQGHGLDLGPGTWHQFNEVLGGTPLTGGHQIGDLAYYGSGGADHVAVYVGNGVLIEARQSGEPVELMSVANQGGHPQWMRPHAP